MISLPFALPVALEAVPVTLPVNGPENPVAVTVPGNDVLPEPSNNVAVLCSVVKLPLY